MGIKSRILSISNPQNVFESSKRIAKNSGLYDHALGLSHYGCTCVSLPHPGELYRTHGCFHRRSDGRNNSSDIYVPSDQLECVIGELVASMSDDALEEKDTHVRRARIYLGSPKCIFYHARSAPKPFFDGVSVGVHFDHECMHDSYCASISKGNWCNCTGAIHDYHNRSLCHSFEGRGLPRLLLPRKYDGGNDEEHVFRARMCKRLSAFHATRGLASSLHH